MDKQHEVAAAGRPFEFFMNRFRLLEAAPRADFANYTGLAESVIRPQLDEALAKRLSGRNRGALADHREGQTVPQPLLELFLADDE